MWGGGRIHITLWKKNESGSSRTELPGKFMGQIEKGRWYRVRVRCQGPRIQAWLDDQLIVDLLDENNPMLRGCVGIGVWESRAAFRNIQVRSLNGQSLLTPEQSLSHRPRYWDTVGRARVHTASCDALNSDLYTVIKGEGGIAQDSLAVDSKESYKGSLWARGNVTGGIVVRLKEGPYVLAEQVLMGIGRDWREKEFEFRPSRSASHARFEVVLVNGGTLTCRSGESDV